MPALLALVALAVLFWPKGETLNGTGPVGELFK
jgi:hypothetical protein